MLYHSLEFLIFFPITVIAYYLMAHRWRWAWLLTASYYFYLNWRPEYIVFILLSTVVAYLTSLKIEQDKKNRSIYFYFNLFVHTAILIYFKYAGFFFNGNIILPLGISFYTFQVLSYSIDVYRGQMPAEKHFGRFALYVVYFPKLFAGPIERASAFLPQLKNKVRFDHLLVCSGLKLMLWGFFKKVVIADRLAIYVDAVYGAPQGYSSLTLIVATVFYSFQIYCDFSGYTDMALGASRVFGLKLMENFQRHYLSKTCAEIWRRWHLSLSTWMRDYIYTPLTIQTRYWGNTGTILSLFVSFVFIGIWHGATWNFVVFGLLQGVFVSAELLTNKSRKRLAKKMPKIFFTFLSMLVTAMLWNISVVFFRAVNFADVLSIFQNIRKFDMSLYIGARPEHFFYGLLGITMMMAVDIKQEYFNDKLSILEHRSPIVREVACASLLALILLLGVFDGGQFIYVQF